MSLVGVVVCCTLVMIGNVAQLCMLGIAQYALLRMPSM
jgi:hypothetical protein